MNEILEIFKKYFRETPREEVLKGWEQAKENAPKSNIKLNEFLNQKCKHEMCKNCRGSGRKENGQTCVHMISCPCQKCSPTYL